MGTERIERNVDTENKGENEESLHVKDKKRSGKEIKKRMERT